MGGVDTLDKDDDELIFEEYIKRLGQVLEMRHRGKWVPETFDRYSESLVQVVAPPPPPRGPSMRGPHLPPLRPSLLSLLVRGFALQLTDDCLKEMYLNFMLIYMGEYTEEVLARIKVVPPLHLPFCVVYPFPRRPHSGLPSSFCVCAGERGDGGGARLRRDGDDENRRAPQPGAYTPPCQCTPNAHAQCTRTRIAMHAQCQRH